MAIKITISKILKAILPYGIVCQGGLWQVIKKILKSILPYGLIYIYEYYKTVLLYNHDKKKGRLHVYSIEETVKKIDADKCSIVRFGDGEISVIVGEGLRFQEWDETLAQRLQDVLGSNEENLLVCIPDVFEGFEKYKKWKGILFWRRLIVNTRKEWEKICTNKNYYNAFISRPYIICLDKNTAKPLFESVIKLWENETIILVEGRYSRLGCGNDLFNKVKSLKRILCPEKNAYRKYDEILKEIIKHDKSKLILLSLGPAAKLLAYDLHKMGYRVLDIGHIDIEYEWYLRDAKDKIIIPGKYVNEVGGGDKDLESFYDKKYESEIIAKII